MKKQLKLTLVLVYMIIQLLLLISSSTTSSKKGFAYSEKNAPKWKDQLTSLNLKWFYTWGNEWPSSIPDSTEFIPMIWSGKKVTDKNIARLKSYNDDKSTTCLLGYNEVSNNIYQYK